MIEFSDFCRCHWHGMMRYDILRNCMHSVWLTYWLFFAISSSLGARKWSNQTPQLRRVDRSSCTPRGAYNREGWVGSIVPNLKKFLRVERSFSAISKPTSRLFARRELERLGWGLGCCAALNLVNARFALAAIFKPCKICPVMHRSKRFSKCMFLYLCTSMYCLWCVFLWFSSVSYRACFGP